MIGLIHLVWAPLGPDPLRGFLRSYRAHPSGAEHELVIVLNGAGGAGPVSDVARGELLSELEGTEHRLIRLDRPTLDLPAYGQAAQLLAYEHVCLLNSYSVVLLDGWLGLLADALARPGVGLAGATGSWESQAEWRRGRIRHWPQQLATLSRARRDYPRFPNPHVRMTAFMLKRRQLADMGFVDAASKRATYLLESGRQSVTRTIHAQGLRAVVVGRDGHVYDVEEWPESHTFRSGDQENLLVADNRTEDYQRARPWRRRQLQHATWGRRDL